MFKTIIRPILFSFDAERIHNFTFSYLRTLYKIPGMGALGRMFHRYDRPELEKEYLGLKFRNPIGLAAGFDKDARLGAQWENLGFGFVELGTVTPRPQQGNPQPRLFRLPEDRAIINRMGFNNQGVDAMVERLKKIKRREIVIGGNIGKNKDTPNAEAVNDYKICFEKLYPYVDYFVVNVSSPNTPGLRELQEKEPLLNLLSTLQEMNKRRGNARPLLLKIAPDLTEGQLDDIVEIAKETRLAGIVATNTTISRAGLQTGPERVTEIGNGGLSGAPLTHHSTEVIRYVREKAGPGLTIIGVGGIMSAADARAKLDAGADLVQVYTGFVYEGPNFAKNLCKGLLQSQ